MEIATQDGSSVGLDEPVTADRTHRGHAIVEQVNADLTNSALAHLPSGKFAANSAWLVVAVIAFNLTRAAATLAGPSLAKAVTATIRRTLITVPARVASSARRLTLRLPSAGPGRPPGPACSPTPADRPHRPPPDHTAANGPTTKGRWRSRADRRTPLPTSRHPSTDITEPSDKIRSSPRAWLPPAALAVLRSGPAPCRRGVAACSDQQREPSQWTARGWRALVPHELEERHCVSSSTRRVAYRSDSARIYAPGGLVLPLSCTRQTAPDCCGAV
jgi:hypothetical protein